MMKNVLTFSFLVVMGLPLTARANLLEGVLTFTGTANVSFGSAAFVDPANSFTTNPAGGQQGGFVALASTNGSIMNITDPPDATGPLDIPNFITFAADPDISITLTYLYAGYEGAAECSTDPSLAVVGQVCTPDFPAQSPFNLENTPTGSTASIIVLGTEIDSSTNDTIPIQGTFTTPFSDESFQQILAIVGDAPPPIGGSITTSFSAEFNTLSATPEPGTLIQLMLGAVGIGLVYRKKFAQA
jgi:hypothetical protein